VKTSDSYYEASSVFCEFLWVGMNMWYQMPMSTKGAISCYYYDAIINQYGRVVPHKLLESIVIDGSISIMNQVSLLGVLAAVLGTGVLALFAAHCALNLVRSSSVMWFLAGW
jgi:hypothetical protein